MSTLSLVMIVRNEEEKLGRCLQSVVPFVDEMIVVDTGSTDGTKEIAKQYGARVFDYPWNDHFAEARNFALRQSTSDWNMILDADEYIHGNGGQIIKNFIQGERRIGRFQIINQMIQDQEVSYMKNYISRVIPKNIFYKGRIHEQIDSDLPRVNLSVEVHHDGYFNTNKSSRNIPLLELELNENPNNPYVLYQLGKEYKGLKQFEKAFETIYKPEFRKYRSLKT